MKLVFRHSKTKMALFSTEGSWQTSGLRDWQGRAIWQLLIQLRGYQTRMLTETSREEETTASLLVSSIVCCPVASVDFFPFSNIILLLVTFPLDV